MCLACPLCHFFHQRHHVLPDSPPPLNPVPLLIPREAPVQAQDTPCVPERKSRDCPLQLSHLRRQVEAAALDAGCPFLGVLEIQAEIQKAPQAPSTGQPPSAHPSAPLSPHPAPRRLPRPPASVAQPVEAWRGRRAGALARRPPAPVPSRFQDLSSPIFAKCPPSSAGPLNPPGVDAIFSCRTH